MKITVKYFGLLAELTGCQEEVFTFEGGTIGELLARIEARHPGLLEKEFQVAQNLEIASTKQTVNHTEVALLPPFSGG